MSGVKRFFCFFIFWATILSLCVTAYAQENDMTSDTADAVSEEILGNMELDGVQEMIDEMLGGESFSFMGTIKKIMSGEEILSAETVQRLLRGLFFSEFDRERGMFFRLLLLILMAAVFSNFVDVFENSQIGAVSFYVVYLLLFVMIMEAFSRLSTSLASNLSWISQFM